MATVLDAPSAEETSSRPFYSVSEAAALLGVSRVTVWRWIKSGRLSPARLGHRTVRIPHADVARLLQPAGPDPARVPNIERGHFVLFYEADAFLTTNVARFLRDGLTQLRGALVVATPEHRQYIAEALEETGFDLDELRVNGRYVDLDAAETLEAFMVDGLPDPVLFRATVGEQVAACGENVRIFGEMVALLVEAGNPEAALALEALWNNLQTELRFRLLCGYPMQQMAGHAMTSVLDGTCDAHTSVIPTEAYSTLLPGDSRMREIVSLQQKAASLEQALRAERAARDEAQAALRLRDEFISIASHELRTPISVLTAQAQLSLRRLQRQGQLEPQRVADALKLVHHQADKLARLVGQLLDVSRLDAGKLTRERGDVDLARLVDQIVVSSRPLTQEHTISLVAPATLECDLDALRIEQVLSNLIDNAIKYSPNGGQIDVSLCHTDDCIELAVRDHGVGIPEEKRAQIFERFYQAHDSGQRGMGLGLYVSRHIVEMHGGEMRAEFPADGGTRMIVRLPFLPASTAGEPARVELASD